MTNTWPKTSAILGAAGLIGSGVANQMALAGIGETLHLIDPKTGLTKAHEIDISEAQALVGRDRPRLQAADSAAGLGPVDLVIVAASAPETPDGNRHDFLAANMALLHKLAPTITELAGTDGLVLIMSNPVDVLADCLVRLTGLAPERVLGYSINDSARLTYALARELDAPVASIEALVLGEHGVGQVPIFSQVRRDGQPVVLTQAQRAAALDYIHGWFGRWSALKPGRSSGWASGVGARVMLERLAAGATVPAAAWSGPVAELVDTFVTLPVRLVDGRVQVAELGPLTAEESTQLAAAAESIQSMARDIDPTLGAGDQS